MRHMDIKQIRITNLRALLGEVPTAAELAKKAGTDPAYISQILSHKTKRGIGDDLARRLEKAFAKPSGWMDHHHIKNDAQKVRMVPLLAWGDVKGRSKKMNQGLVQIPSPESVSEQSFALQIRDDSMHPEFSEGDIIIVDPERQAKHGDFVVVQHGESQATLKQLFVDSSRKYLKPINPRYPIIEMNAHATICGVVAYKSKAY